MDAEQQSFSLLVLLLSTVLVVPLFKRLGLGSVLGYLAAGLIIGPYGLKFFDNPEAILQIAELGVVIFLFVIGLEMKPSQLWQLRKQIFGLGLLQVLTCCGLITLAGHFVLGWAWQSSFIIASGFVLTSTAIVMAILGERGDTTSVRGKKIVSILLLEDLMIVPSFPSFRLFKLLLMPQLSLFGSNSLKHQLPLPPLLLRAFGCSTRFSACLLKPNYVKL